MNHQVFVFGFRTHLDEEGREPPLAQAVWDALRWFRVSNKYIPLRSYADELPRRRNYPLQDFAHVLALELPRLSK